MNNDKIKLLPAAQAVTENFDWGSLTWFAAGALGNGDAGTVGRCAIKPGKNNPPHYHPNCAETLTVSAGHIKHTGNDGVDIEMRVGDTVTIPVGMPHRALNIGTEEAVLSIFFSSADRQTVRV